MNEIYQECEVLKTAVYCDLSGSAKNWNQTKGQASDFDIIYTRTLRDVDIPWLFCLLKVLFRDEYGQNLNLVKPTQYDGTSRDKSE